MNNTNNVFKFLVDMLGYKNFSNFYIEKSDDFDAEYAIKVENKEYIIVGNAIKDAEYFAKIILSENEEEFYD